MANPKIILGIETSCDETAAAVLQRKNGRIHILSNIVSSSASLQASYGGVLPEQAAREQVKMIIPIIEQAINDSRLMINEVDAIVVTKGPGLIGSLLVGVETAKTLAKVWNKPLIPVNHLLGHFYANWITTSVIPANAGIQLIKSTSKLDPRLRGDDKKAMPSFPAIGLLVSGGHTDLIYFKGHHNYEHLGGTRDDAAGECFDKCARLLGFPYPGGPQIAKLALQGDALRFNLPRPMIDSKNFDFSFSGLKTAFANQLSVLFPSGGPQSSETKFSSPQLTGKQKPDKPISENRNPKTDNRILTDLCASLEQAIVDVLVAKTVQAVEKYRVKQIIIAGGVAANQKLHSELELKIENCKLKIRLSIPAPNLCTDNAAMTAARAFFEKSIKNPLDLQADPSLSLQHN